MDCQKFELIATDFARESLTDARTLKSAILHVEICPPCARRLAHERRLTAVLQTVAADSVNDSTPARVETNLLAAFRTQHAEQTIASMPVSRIAPTSNVIPFVSHQTKAKRNSWRRPAIGAALAACLTLVFVTVFLSAWRGRISDSTATQQTTNVKTQPIVKNKNIAVETTSHDDVTARKSDAPKTVSITTERIAHAVRPHRAFASTPSNRTPRANAKRTETPAEANGTDEIATDFLTLTPTTTDALEGGQIVRVELPHSALAAFGLPFNADRANEKMKADVVLSADGVARAIRFVR